MEEYWKRIEIMLNGYQDLRRQIPLKWPRCITWAQVKNYEKHRNDKFWEHMNLPTLIFTLSKLDIINDENTIGLYRSILGMLEWFANEMINLPGAAETLRPLWENSWNIQDNSFWSVVSEVAMTRHLKKMEWEIIGFNQKISPNSEKDADIRAVKKNILCHIDIEGSSLTKVIEGEEKDFRSLICHRANAKIDKKFKDVPDNECGIVAIIFRPQTANMNRFYYGSTSTDWVKTDRKNIFGKIYWLTGGCKPGEGYSLQFVDNSLISEPF